MILVATDYFSKVIAQTFLGVKYASPILLPSHQDKPILFFVAIATVIVAFTILKEIVPTHIRIIEFSQILFFAGVAGSVLDIYLYPANIKWLFNTNLAEIYQLSSLVILLVLLAISLRKIKGKK